EWLAAVEPARLKTIERLALRHRHCELPQADDIAPGAVHAKEWRASARQAHGDKQAGLRSTLHQQAGELDHGRRLEHRAERKVLIGERSNYLPHYPRRKQRISTELEEVIVNAYPVEVQHLGPDPRQLLFHLCPRRDETRTRFRTQVTADRQ